MSVGNGLLSRLLLFSGIELIGAVSCVLAFIVRIRSKRKDPEQESQEEIDAAVLLLFVSVVLPVVGLKLESFTHRQEWILLAIIGVFATAPISGILAFKGRGVGRKILLIGYGAMILWGLSVTLFAFL